MRSIYRLTTLQPIQNSIQVPVHASTLIRNSLVTCASWSKTHGQIVASHSATLAYTILRHACLTTLRMECHNQDHKLAQPGNYLREIPPFLANSPVQVPSPLSEAQSSQEVSAATDLVTLSHLFCFLTQDSAASFVIGLIAPAPVSGLMQANAASVLLIWLPVSLALVITL